MTNCTWQLYTNTAYSSVLNYLLVCGFQSGFWHFSFFSPSFADNNKGDEQYEICISSFLTSTFELCFHLSHYARTTRDLSNIYCYRVPVVTCSRSVRCKKTQILLSQFQKEQAFNGSILDMAGQRGASMRDTETAAEYRKQDGHVGKKN